jgi:polysaccharide export outer membrane protein
MFKYLNWLSLLLACAAQAGLPAEPPADARGQVPKALHQLDLSRADVEAPIKLDSDDVVKMVVLGFPELTHVTKVQRDGRASLPMVGDVPARGLTLGQFQDDVAHRLAAGFDNGPLKLRPDDTIKMTVWQNLELTSSATVMNDGTLTLPLVGNIQTEGRTLEDIRKLAEQRLAQYIREPKVSILPERIGRRGRALIDPQVSILLEKTRDRTVAVLGEVQIQGLQPIQRGLRVLDVLAQARYIANNADLDSVVLIRNPNGAAPEYTQLHVDQYIAGKAPDQNPLVQADDVLIVPKSTITKVGDFVDRFFARTKPVFDWWIGLEQARYAEDYNRGVIRLNELLYQNTPK